MKIKMVNYGVKDWFWLLRVEWPDWRCQKDYNCLSIPSAILCGCYSKNEDVNWYPQFIHQVALNFIIIRSKIAHGP